MMEKSQPLPITSMKHKEHDCPLVANRVACNSCGYPQSEALYGNEEELQWPVYEEALGG